MWEDGTSTVEIRPTFAQALSGLGRFPTGPIQGTQSTLLAARAAPPDPYEWYGSIVLAVVIVILAVSTKIPWLLMFEVVPALLIRRAILWNRNVWPRQYALWRTCIVCSSCGHIGVPA